MVNGKYSLYIDNVKYGEYDNVVTTSGLNLIKKYLTGSVAEWAGSIAIGAMNSNDSASTDTILQYEFARYPINLKSYDTTTGEIILKASFPSSIVGKIYELGVYSYTRNPFSNGYDDKILFNFDEYWLNTTTQVAAGLSTTGRTGSYDLPISSGASSAVECSINLDLSGYSNTDTLDILYNVTASQTSGVRAITFKFTDNQSPAGTASLTASVSTSASGYKVHSLALSNLTKDSTFNNLVSKISLTVEGTKTSVLYLDSAKIRDVALSDDNLCLVSRALIGVVNSDTANDYFNKTIGAEMDIEYRMTIS